MSQLCVWRITSQQFRVATRCTFCGSSAARVIEKLIAGSVFGCNPLEPIVAATRTTILAHAARLCPRRLLERARKNFTRVLVQQGRHTRLCRILTENRQMLVGKCFHGGESPTAQGSQVNASFTPNRKSLFPI